MTDVEEDTDDGLAKLLEVQDPFTDGLVELPNHDGKNLGNNGGNGEYRHCLTLLPRRCSPSGSCR